MKRKKKLPVSGSSTPLEQSPFANLQLAGLPEGKSEPAAAKIEPSPPQPSSRLVLRREKSHRGGKTVVVISHVPDAFTDSDLQQLAKSARKSLGCGGSVHGREVELQGDQPDRVRQFLQTFGHRVVGP